MKKIFLTLVVTTFFGAGVYAQGVSGGLKIGANFANQKISFDGISLDTKSKIGFQAGAYLTAMFSEKFGIQPEVLFSMQGSKSEIFGEDSKINMNYINIPVMFRYNINEMFNVHAGPQLGLLMTAEGEADGETEDIKDTFTSTDFGFAFGAGVDLPAGLNIGLRYSLGLSNIVDDSDFEGDFKNNNLQVYLGYTLFGNK